MHSSDNNLFFDADYTTRAIAIGVMPTREYVTVGQLRDRYLDPCEFQNIPVEETDWKDYADDYTSFNPDQL